MRRFIKMPPQVLRIFLLAVGIVVCYSVARYFLTPESFKQYGWYRGEALAEMANRYEPSFAGRKACDECHSDVVQKLAKHEHKSLSCEGCHGPGQAHSDNPDIKIDIVNFSTCARCHEANPSRPKWHKQINISNHYGGGSKCTECHVPHSPNDVP
ncbi:MAG TPA: cytochrome c3 family protein [Candidatus Dormibacteraeota bacterium]|nr:cytochrome c3 family protein [Candidatus Dormibacteraeota bacterium]